MNDILTHVLNTFIQAIGGGFGRLEPSAQHLLYTVMTLDLVFFGLFAIAADGGPIMVKGLRKLLSYGFFVLLVTRWPSLVAMLVRGFVWAGQTAGGNVPGPSVQDPSAIIDFGFNVAQPMLDKVGTLAHGFTGTMENLPTIGLYEMCIIGTIAAFLIIAIQCFIAYLEFMIVAVLSMVFLPFGPWKHTKFLSEKSLGAVVSHGIKLMTLTFIVAIAGTVLPSVIPAAGVSVHDAIVAMGTTLAIALLCVQAPNLASGLMSGSPSLGAGAALGTAAGAAMGGAAAVRGSSTMASGAAKLATGGVGAVAAAAGAVSQGAMAGAAAKAGGAGLAFRASAGAAGAGQAAVTGLARKATAPAQTFGNFLKTNFQHGQIAENTRRTEKGGSAAKAGAVRTAPSPTPATAANSARSSGSQPTSSARTTPVGQSAASSASAPTGRRTPTGKVSPSPNVSDAAGTSGSMGTTKATSTSRGSSSTSSGHPTTGQAPSTRVASTNAAQTPPGGQRVPQKAQEQSGSVGVASTGGMGANPRERQTAGQLAQQAINHARPSDGGGGINITLHSDEE